jgi:putative DNA primase/helicase
MPIQDSAGTAELLAPARNNREFLNMQLASRELSEADATFHLPKPSLYLANECGDNNVPQIVIVNYDALGTERLDLSRTRFDTRHPNCPKKPNGEPIKYKLRPGVGVVIYNHSKTSHQEWIAAEEKWLAEGEFKAIALAKLGKAVKGFGGCRTWHLKGSDDLHPDASEIRPGEVVIVAMDGDWHTKIEVHVGAYMLMQAIRRKGALALLLDLPPDEKIDDLIARWRREGHDPQLELSRLPRKRLEEIPNPFVIDSSHPHKTAQSFVAAMYPDQTLVRWRGQFYRWHGAGWSLLPDEEDIRAEVYHFVAQNGGNPKQGFVTNIMDAICAVVNLDIERAPAWRSEAGRINPKELFACANGLLDLRTRTLLPHTPDYFNLNWSDIAFQSEADAPRWSKFLGEVYPGDTEAQRLLQEWLGYVLTDDTSQQKMLMMVGVKRSGKGTIARVAQQLVGYASYCSPTLGSLGERFGLAPLLGKKLAVVSDARISGKRDLQATVENMLRVSGEDGVSIDRKNLPALESRLTARFWVITNLLPGMLDEGGAFASRFLILSHGVSFFNAEDEQLTVKLLAEVSGVLNWALDGLDSLRKRGHFLQPASGKEKLHDLERMNSPIKAFIEDRCKEGPDAWVKKDDLFAEYLSWCRNVGKIGMTLDKERFTQSLYAATDERVKGSKKRIDKKQIPVFVGVRLRDVPKYVGVPSVPGVPG